MAIVIENNRIHCWTYCLTIGYCSPGQELYVVKFTALNLNYKWVFREAIVTKPLFQLINHIYMGQDTRDMANYCLI